MAIANGQVLTAEDFTSTMWSDTGWVALTPTSGSGTCVYRAIGKVISVRLGLSGVTSISPGTDFTIVNAGGIPSAARPPSDVYAMGNGGGSAVTQIIVRPDGSVGILNVSSAGVTVGRANFTYLA